MTNKVLKYIFTVLSATYFLLAGTGYNVVNYCCNSCANEGIEKVAESSCSDVHHHTNIKITKNHVENIANTNVLHESDGCYLFRLNIDIPSVHSNQNKPVSFYYFSHLFYTAGFLVHDYAQLKDVTRPPNFNFRASGRNIITLHSVLLI